MVHKRWTFWLLSLMLLLAIGWGFWERANRLNLVHAVEGSGQRDFYNLLSHVEQAEVSLGKALVSSSQAQQASLLTEASNRSSFAQTSLSQLPTPGINLVNTRKFLAQTADYCQYLAQKIARGEEPRAEETQNLLRLRQEMGKLAADLHNIEGQVATRSIRWSSFYSVRMPSLPRTIAWLSALPVQTTPHPLEGFVNTERQLESLPSLNYDGPFSDHLEKTEPQGLAPQPVDQPGAESKALKFASEASGTSYRVVAASPVNGRIPCFGLSLADERNPGRQVRIDVSRQGGHVISFLNPRAVDNPTLDASAALERARSFLRAQGFPDLIPTYSVSQGHTQLFSFVASENNVLLYPDQVKVRVALDNGEIVGFDATPFYMSHHKRNLQKPRISAEQAMAKVKPHLKVEGARLALIPTGGGREVLTYEVSTRLDNERYLVYYNALTGEEEKIMRIIDVPGGELTM